MSPQMFSVLSEQNRFAIIELLYQHPHPVNDIARRLHLNQPQVSKHLKVLADAGVVKVYPVAQQRIYALSPEPFKDLDIWLKKYKTLWENKFERLDALLQKQKK